MNERMTATVGARISEFRRKMAEVNAIARRVPNRVVIDVVARTKRTQDRLDRIANSIRTIQTVAGNMAMGSLLALSPSAVPILAGVAASLAMLGPMLGTVAGSTFALASAFGVAGAGAVAFGSVATSALNDVFAVNKDVKKLQEELSATEDKDKRAAILEEIKQAQSGLSSEQQKGLKAVQKFSSFWGDFAQQFQKPVMDVFVRSLGQLKSTLKTLEPMFQGAAKAFNNLSKSLTAGLQSDAVQGFFNYLNKTAGPMLETLGKSFGNFTKGLMDMMVAFGPLSESTAQGFLEMSQRFADWASGLSESKSFQKFVSFVEKNMPKVRAIFRDAVAGITYFFAAFGPLASDMMSGLKDMMASFKEWSKGLGDNKSFQNFINYIRDNGPTIKSFIGEMVQLIANLVSGMAPLGAKILEIVTGFLSWTNTIMENNPWVKKLLGFVLVGIGLFQALVPPIILAVTWFAGIGKVLGKIFPFISKVWGIINTKLLPVFTRIFLVIQRVLPWILRMGKFIFGLSNPIGWIITIVTILAAVIIKHWDKIWKWTKEIFGAVWTFLKFIWFKTKRFLIDTFIGIFKAAVKKFRDIKKAVSEKMTAVLDKVKDIGNSILDFFGGIDLKESGKKIIQSAIDGISSMKNKVVSKVKNIASSIRDFFPFSPAKTGPLSTLHKLDFAGPVSDSITRGKSEIQRSMQGMLSTPAIEGIGMNVGVPDNYSSREETNVNMAGVFEGAELTIREEADIDRLARALGERVKDNKRARGIR